MEGNHNITMYFLWCCLRLLTACFELAVCVCFLGSFLVKNSQNLGDRGASNSE